MAYLPYLKEIDSQEIQLTLITGSQRSLINTTILLLQLVYLGKRRHSYHNPSPKFVAVPRQALENRRLGCLLVSQLLKPVGIDLGAK